MISEANVPSQINTEETVKVISFKKPAPETTGFIGRGMYFTERTSQKRGSRFVHTS